MQCGCVSNGYFGSSSLSPSVWFTSSSSSSKFTKSDTTYHDSHHTTKSLFFPASKLDSNKKPTYWNLIFQSVSCSANKKLTLWILCHSNSTPLTWKWKEPERMPFTIWKFPLLSTCKNVWKIKTVVSSHGLGMSYSVFPSLPQFVASKTGKH